MELLKIIYLSYILFGITLIFFNSFFAVWIYRIVIMLTDKAQVSDAFLFKIDKNNRDTFYFLIRSFCVMFGVILAISSFYFMSIY